MNKELYIWNIVTEILENYGDIVDNISIHEHEDCLDEFRKIYCSDGYCFELKREKICEPEEVKDTAVQDLEEDGYVYFFNEPWDGFKEAGIDKAIKILNIYGRSIKE